MSMEVISVNIWLILISLCNLLILFLILKKFLFKPVTKTLDERKKAIDADYAAAAEANSAAALLRTREGIFRPLTADRGLSGFDEAPNKSPIWALRKHNNTAAHIGAPP